MARLVWTHRATADLNEIAEYIAIDNFDAAVRFAERVYSRVEQLIEHPESGPVVPEFPESEYRQIIEPPCRIFYKIRGNNVYIVHIMRFERILRPSWLDHEIEDGQ